MSDPSHYVDMEFLIEKFSPYTHTVWLECRSPITVEEVRAAIEANDLKDTHYEGYAYGFGSQKTWTRQDHIRRVAWLVVNGWDDVLGFDIGVPDLGCYVSWWLDDGNHRLAAMIYKGEKGEVPVSVCGSMAYAEELGFREIPA